MGDRDGEEEEENVGLRGLKEVGVERAGLIASVALRGACGVEVLSSLVVATAAAVGDSAEGGGRRGIGAATGALLRGASCGVTSLLILKHPRDFRGC